MHHEGHFVAEGNFKLDYSQVEFSALSNPSAWDVDPVADEGCVVLSQGSVEDVGELDSRVEALRVAESDPPDGRVYLIDVVATAIVTCPYVISSDYR